MALVRHLLRVLESLYFGTGGDGRVGLERERGEFIVHI